jgi:hypothetical protein
VAQNESFPGRPRGRRARQDGDAAEWQGYDAMSQDQREFPDLAPIRPREARARDGRAQGGQPGQQPGQPGGGYGGSYPGDGAPGYPPGQPAAGGYGSGQYGGHQGGYGGPAQAPWDEQPRPDPQAGQADSAPPQRHQQPAKHAAAPQRPARRKQDDAPSWAEPDSIEAFSERWHRRGIDSRDEQRAGRRRSRRRLLIAGAAVVALAIAATIYLYSGGPGAANLGFGGLVTNFQLGELQQVPDPCTTVPAATLQQYMPGTLKQAAPPLNSGASTECTWTLDSAPTYRVLQVQLQAYSPSGLASGDGSATFAAEDAYQSFENGFTSPGPKSGQPAATVTDLSGMPGGTETSAFQATQVFTRGGATTDVANVLVRYRNVIITVVVDGLDQTSGGKKYGPVAMSDLTSEANATAREMASQIAK